MVKLILLLLILNFFLVLVGGDFWAQMAEQLLSGDNSTKEGIENLQKLLRTESKTEIVKMEKEPGFKELNSKLIFEENYGIEAKHISYILNNMKKRIFMNIKLTDGDELNQMKESIGDILTEIEMMDRKNYVYRDVTFKSDTGGSGRLLTIAGRKNGNKYDVVYYMYEVKFKLAPERIIMTKTKNNFFRSSSKMFIVEKDQPLTDIQTDEIFSIMGKRAMLGLTFNSANQEIEAENSHNEL